MPRRPIAQAPTGCLLLLLALAGLFLLGLYLIQAGPFARPVAHALKF
ncbi:MAG: hypothetical protein ACRYG7_10200 [Janthinobacterium lividum]